MEKLHLPPAPLCAFVLEPEVQVGTVTASSGFPYKTGMHTSNGIRPRGKYRFRKHPAHSRTPQEIQGTF